MGENNNEMNEKFSLYEKFQIDDMVSVYPDSDNFNDLDCPPCTCKSEDCCGKVSEPIKFQRCEIVKKEEIRTNLDCEGRLLKIKVILDNVCFNKKIAVGVIIFNEEGIKGFKVKEIEVLPPTEAPGEDGNHCTSCCCKFCFVLPGSVCPELTLKARVIAHYTGFHMKPGPTHTPCPCGS